jgi:hypothetical protein
MRNILSSALAIAAAFAIQAAALDAAERSGGQADSGGKPVKVYIQNAETYLLVGQAMGQGMVELLKSGN